MKVNINNDDDDDKNDDDTKKVSEHDNNKISKILAPIDGSELSRRGSRLRNISIV